MAWFTPKEDPSLSRSGHPKRPLMLHDTMSDAGQEFTETPGKPVRMYNCGPTVYGPAHIGNLRSYVFADILRRTLEYNGFGVQQVINITDVGHLSSDSDEGEDKMSKGLRREGLTLTLENMHALAEKYAEAFCADLRSLSIRTDAIEFPRASAYIDAMIAMIQALEEKGYAYPTSDGLYFDTSRFPLYGALGKIDIAGQQEGARVEINQEKKHPADFNLWKKDAALGWPSPWGQGFPGWHIECSAMARATLGEQIDIHTGGIDHIPIHHNNEIAQSESATGKHPFARIWMHNAFLTLGEEKIAKSAGTGIMLADLSERGIHPLALRYFYLGARYRTPLDFSWDALLASQQALLRLHAAFRNLPDDPQAAINPLYQVRFHERINDDLDTPGALSIVWELLKDADVQPGSARATLRDFDTVLGLALEHPDPALRALVQQEFGVAVPEAELPDDVRALMAAREEARRKKEWTEADRLRAEIKKLGFTIEDLPEGARILKKGAANGHA